MSAHAILATVADRPGILHGLTKVLADHEANITYVDIHNGDPHSTRILELTLERTALDTVLADLRQVPGVASVIETPSFAKIYGKRIIVMGGGAQVGLVAMGAISKQIDTTSAANAFRWTPFPWSANRSWQRPCDPSFACPARASWCSLAPSWGATSRPPSRKFGSRVYTSFH